MSDWVHYLALAAYVGTCWNLWHAWKVREEAQDLNNEIEKRLSEWRDAGKEAVTLWDYGARLEAIEVLSEVGMVKAKVVHVENGEG